ncbi:purine/pyrimidine permease [Fictibacillus sp. FJAT-27399]|uniref:purine/pyrimidine permease n=1 Tax=Fictibacillus sp. FJAT-27399 TaxID=1729689 RepID=UPI0007837245|nr:purine/pyrimidine permease [Fictibacillus sp. FJAT-27399]
MKLFFSSFQWMVFILAGSIVAPISIGTAFHLPPAEIAELLQRTFFIIGISGFLQALFGHHLPITEGPAGLWWGVFMVYAGLVSAGSLNGQDVLHQLEMGMLICGLLFIFLGLMKWIGPLKKLFTPLVTGTYLILLVAQLSGSFIKGILGIGYLSNSVDGKVAVTAIAILILSMILGKAKSKFLRSYSVLISLIAGWGLFSLLGLVKDSGFHGKTVALPEIFAWGAPQFSGGIALTSIIIGFLLLANMVASVNVVENVYKNEKQPHSDINYNQTTGLMGLNTLIAGLLSAVASVPISGTAGFILTTKMFQRLPYIIGSLMILAISLFPKLTFFFASIPAPVGYATIFVPFSSMIGLALKEYRSLKFNENTLFVIATSLMIGLGCTFIPPAALKGLPNILTTLLNNGLILGMLTCMLLEQLNKRQTKLSDSPSF